MPERVTLSITDFVADVRLNRPDKRNALDNAMFAAIAEIGQEIASQADVRAVVLSGAGESFCAGLDFGSFASMTGGTGEEDGATGATSSAMDAPGSPGTLMPDGLTHLGQHVAWVWQQIPVPVIAAVHGHALGGGIQIALGADIRIVHPATKLSVREVHWGLTPDMTGTQVLARLCRPDVAKELVFTARVFDGTEAFRLGLATRLSDTPLDDALVMAGEIAGRSPDAVRGAKALINRMVNAGAAEQFAEERRAITSLIGTPNQIEAVMSNFEDRPAVFG